MILFTPLAIWSPIHFIRGTVPQASLLISPSYSSSYFCYHLALSFWQWLILIEVNMLTLSPHHTCPYFKLPSSRGFQHRITKHHITNAIPCSIGQQLFTLILWQIHSCWTFNKDFLESMSPQQIPRCWQSKSRYESSLSPRWTFRCWQSKSSYESSGIELYFSPIFLIFLAFHQSSICLSLTATTYY